MGCVCVYVFFPSYILSAFWCFVSIRFGFALTYDVNLNMASFKFSIGVTETNLYESFECAVFGCACE